jgi:hypothetical protein
MSRSRLADACIKGFFDCMRALTASPNRLADSRRNPI